MSVFTPLSTKQAAAWLEDYELGTLEKLTGIAEGVQNSNFFLDTTLGRYVLTIFEQAPGEQLFFHMQLLAHLAGQGIPCPAPVANRRNEYVGQLQGKPAVIVSRLPGSAESSPTCTFGGLVGSFRAIAAASRPSPSSRSNPESQTANTCRTGS